MNLSGLDLNLLVALDALLEQRSVTRAAEQLHLSQPALSASLARLRHHFNDQLLTRAGNESRLTPLAVRLKERTREALGSIERVFGAESEFDPSISRREFRIVLSDYATVIFGGILADLLNAEAPHARLRFLNNTPSIVDRAQQALLGIDLIVMPHGFLADLSCENLYEEDWVYVISGDNPAAARKLTVEDLRTLPWVLTYNGPTASTPAARQLQLLGIEPTAQVVTENFLTIPGLVAGTNRIARSNADSPTGYRPISTSTRCRRRCRSPRSWKRCGGTPSTTTTRNTPTSAASCCARPPNSAHRLDRGAPPAISGFDGRHQPKRFAFKALGSDRPWPQSVIGLGHGRWLAFPTHPRGRRCDPVPRAPAEVTSFVPVPFVQDTMVAGIHRHSRRLGARRHVRRLRIPRHAPWPDRAHR
jgi:DNA-binding transcriptional LysR family regulator